MNMDPVEEERQREAARAFERKWRVYNSAEGWSLLRFLPAVIVSVVCWFALCRR